MAFDWDCDEVLTISEIKDGLKVNNIELMDHELQKLIDVIDKDCDGVLTCDEWINILDPRLDAQGKFTDLMGDIDINDPLDLEERILDLQFKKRRLDNEVRVMRRQNRTDNFFRNAKIKEEHKVVSERIKDLELKVKANNNKNHDAQEDFNTKLSKGP